MRSTLLPLVLLWLAISELSAQLPVQEPMRQWSITGGQSFQASVTAFDGTTAQLRGPTGNRGQAVAATLSAADQQYLTEWLKRQPIKVVMPDVVTADAAQIKTEVVSEDAAAEKFVYRTTHFEFESQGKFTQTLLREVARNFEATYELLKALPWEVGPKPASGQYFRARLLKDRASYMAAGGMPNSGGVYRSREETFMVPFESIGVKVVGKSYAKDDKFETHTMVHELTHQMMHFWLNYLPQWVVEGTAEYTGVLPLHNGSFRVSAAKTGLKDYAEYLKKQTVGGLPEPYPLDKLFSITNEEWAEVMAQDPRSSHRLYFTSYMLVYYFMQLDGKGDAQLFTRYFREVGSVRKEVEDYEKALEAFKKLPGVTVNANGGFRYPNSMTPPKLPAVVATPEARTAFQKKTLQILLDGRSEADLMKQIQSAFTKLGIRTK